MLNLWKWLMSRVLRKSTARENLRRIFGDHVPKARGKLDPKHLNALLEGED